MDASDPPAHRSATDVDTPLGLAFPDGFAWGAATSAFQIEGAARLDGRGDSVWDTFCRTPGKIAGDHNGDIAADHYNRVPDDVALMKQLGLQTYRFSIAWPRIMPDGSGPANQRGLDFYKRLVDELHSHGITPMATLFHWDLPQALQDKGGWESRDVSYLFADYAEVLFRELGDSVPTWLTINEPKTVVQNGYLHGHHAPGFSDEGAAYLVAHHLQLAHGLGVQAFRASGLSGRIGPALNLHPCYPAEDTAESAAAARLFDGYENRLYLDSIVHGHYPEDVLADLGEDSRMVQAIRATDLAIISSPVDLLAVQYYCPIYVKGDGTCEMKLPTSQASWQQIYPNGMYDVLTRVHRDYGGMPITVTENGLPTRHEPNGDGRVDDVERVQFLRDHFAAAHKAVAEGVRLESYHVWSLMDNFEWDQGYGERWGLVHVDYDTLRRTPKRSALWYKDVIARNGV